MFGILLYIITEMGNALLFHALATQRITYMFFEVELHQNSVLFQASRIEHFLKRIVLPAS